MTIRTHIGFSPYKKPKTTRTRNGVRQALFGGYAFWWGRGDKRRYKEVRVWADASIQDDDCGQGTNTIVDLLLKKIDPQGKRKAVIQESWRY